MTSNDLEEILDCCFIEILVDEDVEAIYKEAMTAILEYMEHSDCDPRIIDTANRIHEAFWRKSLGISE